MSVENQTEEVKTEEVETVAVEAIAFDPFAENQPEPEQKTNVVAETVTEVVENVPRETETTTEETEEEIVDANEYLKTNLGFDSWDDAKTAIAELKTLKEKASTPAEIKYANEQSKLMAEYILSGEGDKLYEVLDTQKKLAAVDKMDAAAAIKLKIQHDNKHYKPEDVADVFEEKYDIPEKPEQKVDELDEEFEARVAKWNVKAEKVNRRMERDSVTAKAELSKLRSELVLPDIFKKEAPAKAAEITPEDLAKNKAYTESYLKSVETSVKSFSGFTATVKDKDVEIPISYSPTDEQKTKIASDMKLLAENNYDVNILFGSRWVKEDGSINTDQMTKDYFRLLYGEQAEQKFANEGASKRVAEKTKKDSNITIKSNSTPSRTFAATDNAAEKTKMAEYFFQNG